MAGNLEEWGKVTVKKTITTTDTIKEYAVAARKYIVHIIAVIATVTALLQAGLTYIDKVYPPETPVAVVKTVEKEKQTTTTVSEEKLRSMTAEPEKTFKEAVSNNLIGDMPKGSRLASKFSSDDLRADLLIPEKNVDVYKFVKIRTDKEASFFDLMVITVVKNNAVFVDTVATANKGEWVFTGPPGQYAIRLAAYDPIKGISTETGNVIIGEPEPPPPPPPPVTKVVVPNVIGMTYDIASAILNQVGLVIGGTNTPGAVSTQIPVAGESVSKGSSVLVVVTPPKPPVPPTPPVFTEKYGFSTFSYNEVLKVDVASRDKYKNQLAANFEAIAAKIAAGAYSGVSNPIATSQLELSAMNKMTLNNNDPATVAPWVTFYTNWSAKATAMNHDPNNPLPNLVSEYAVVYLESAKGLKAAQ